MSMTISVAGGDQDSFRACWATLLTSEHLLPGLVVFADSLLREHKSIYPLVVMVTPKLSERGRRILSCIQGVMVRDIDPIYPSIQRKRTDFAYPRFGEVWSKLRAWELTEFDRVVLVDSDMLVRNNMDELLEHPFVYQNSNPPQDRIASSYACTCNPNKIKTYPDDWTPANCAYTPQTHPESLENAPQPDDDSPRTHKLINSGLVVLRPSTLVLSDMIHSIETDERVASYKFPDQDFLADWYMGRLRVLPWCYNALKKLRQVHEQLWRDEHVRNVHYILDKPWVLGRPGGSANSNDPDDVTHTWWWTAFDRLRTRISHQDSIFSISNDDWVHGVEKYMNFD